MSAYLGLVVVLVIISLGVLAAIYRRFQHRNEVLGIITIFGPALARVELDPRELVPWSEVATSARSVFPRAFQELDRTTGSRFPFSDDKIEAVHARWTTQWLAWERDHDLEYKRRATEIEVELEVAQPEKATLLNARLAEVEQEKLLSYQERYEEYVRIGKAIGQLVKR